MTIYRPCVFCNQTDSPPSREHVFAQWISREWPGKGVWDIENSVTGAKFKANRIELVSRKPCVRCNTGWMRQLESGVKPILVPLMNGQRATLSREQQLLVARWFIKTAIMHEMLGPEPYYFQPYERKALETSLEVPKPTLFFLGQYRGERPMTSVAIHIPLVAGESTDRATPISGYSVTFTIKQLALQLFSLRVPPTFPFDTVSLHLPANLSDMAVQFWPVVDDPLTWPPPFWLDEDGLELFQSRWTVLNEPPS